jgi:hypothetical protein
MQRFSYKSDFGRGVVVFLDPDINESREVFVADSELFVAKAEQLGMRVCDLLSNAYEAGKREGRIEKSAEIQKALEMLSIAIKE